MKTGFEKSKRTVWQCGRPLLAALFLLSAIALGQTQPPAKPEPAPIRPFKMHVPDRVLIDLRFLRTPVVAILPIVREFPNLLDVGAVLPGRARKLIGPVGFRQTAAKIN